MTALTSNGHEAELPHHEAELPCHEAELPCHEACGRGMSHDS
jgi:hypothetical protein